MKIDTYTEQWVKVDDSFSIGDDVSIVWDDGLPVTVHTDPSIEADYLGVIVDICPTQYMGLMAKVNYPKYVEELDLLEPGIH